MASDSKSAIVEDYAQCLTDLTFNSRPIIDNLTTIAKENTNVADGITNAITNRILKCIPDHKLFALYVLDSVCKNVGNPYNILVGDEIFKLFSHVYLLVNGQVRQKLVNLFETWKITKTKGTNLPLFPREQLDKISAFLTQAHAKNSKRNDQLTNEVLIDDINTLVPIFQNKLINNPDPRLTDRFNALNQLKTLLQSQTMNVNELQAVQTQLQTIKQQELNTYNTPIPTPAATPATTPGLPNTPKVQNNKARDIFGMLVVSGLIKVDQSLKPGSLPTYELNFPKQKYQPTVNIPNNVDLPSNSVLEQLLINSNAKFNIPSSNIARTEYEQIKFNELNNLAIDSKGLQNFINTNKISNSTKSLLYEAKSSKCGTCGKRFTTDEAGVSKRRLHLDWHFRINKKMATSSVQSRVWYLDDYDWVKFRDENLLEYSTTSNTESLQTSIMNNSNVTKAETPYVTIPSNETNMNNKCLICRDQIKATYNDDLGEWCWFNCIRAPGEGKNSRKICHATCFNEANKKRGAVDELNTKVKREKF